MNEEWAAGDYEPTMQELQELLEGIRKATAEPGHGQVNMLLGLERYIWEVEGVFWGHREVDGDVVSFSWLRPERP